MKALAVIIVLCGFARCQTFELAAGDSTLMNGAGASVKTYLPGHTVTTGAGFADGHFRYGASDAFTFRGFDVTTGDSSFGFSPDGAGGLAEQVRGVTVSRTRGQSTVAVFAGATGLGFNFPFFSALDAHHFGGGVFARRKLGAWKLATLAAMSGSERTVTGSAAYTSPKFHFTGAGGLAHGQLISSGAFDYRPKQNVAFGAARQDLFYGGQSATVNSVSAFASFDRFTATGSALEGQSTGRRMTGQSAMVTARFGAVTLGSAFYRSSGQAVAVQTVSQNFRHWHFQQSLTGARSLSAGGGYRGNRFSVSLDHSESYLPFAQRWGRVTSISINFRIRGSSVGGGVTVLPGGAVKYTAAGSSFVKGPLAMEPGSSAPKRRATAATGRVLIRGSVIDRAGNPVAGAAVTVGNQQVFTDSGGRFFVRFKKPEVVKVTVTPEEFIAPGKWSVILAPDSATPESEIKIEVDRK